MNNLVRHALTAAIVSTTTASANPQDTFATHAPLAIRNVTPSTTRIPCFKQLELDVDLAATYTNPFDSKQITLDATVTGPDGGMWSVPGFFYQACTRKLANETETITPVGNGQWKVRLSFASPGKHTVAISATDASGTVAAQPIIIEVVPADVPGMARVHPTDPRYLATDRGDPLFLIGANVCWGGKRGTLSYDEWLPKYAENGGNFFRVWLAPPWTTFALNTLESGAARIDLRNAWRLDYVVQRAEELGLHVMLCIDSFNIIRSTKRQHGSYEDAPYHPARGGTVAKPQDYFSRDDVLTAYRDRLRYLVARYGYSPSVLAWEFWNEVDIVDDYNSRLVTRWHRDMARFLRNIDPWKHLVTTSTARASGDARLDRLPELDVVQTHHYQARDMALELGRDRDKKRAAGNRPHFHGEFGISHSGKTTAKLDPAGVHLHNGLYASVGQQQAGTPMTWWWDSYIHPQGLYTVFGAFARWIDGFQFGASGTVPVSAQIEFRKSDAPPALGEVEFPVVRGSWKPAPFNRPGKVTAGANGKVTQTAPLSNILHGLRNHARLHNPATFDLELPEATTFTVEVHSVSGHGGAHLQISVDGNVALDKDMPDPDDTKEMETLYGYSGSYTVDVPAGRHMIKVENIGKDWAQLEGYRIAEFVAMAETPVRVVGLKNDNQALVWVQNSLHTWGRAGKRKRTVPATPASTVMLADFAPGEWNAEWWDTVAGKVTDTSLTTVGKNGKLRIDLPPIAWDTALRIRRQDPQ
ncbi:MAG: cellulase family glycosylhydrolase [Lentisphaerae bacterium]|nr:cellulase family glycosylhydrolase [Lentisphaerota bacterium]